MLVFVATLALAALQEQPEGATKELLTELKSYRHKILYESNRDGNWEIYLANADGSNPVNLTKTPDLAELYPKASPDGTKVCFCCDEGKDEHKRRNLYLMNIDGSGRRKFADNGREPCWSADSKFIAYVPGEFEQHTYSDFATKGIRVYELATGQTKAHPYDSKIEHLYTLNLCPDSKWYVSTVHGGMGFKHGIIAIEAEGPGVFDLKLSGCRPDVSPDGKMVIWGHGDYAVGLAELDFSGATPTAKFIRDIVQSKDPMETYHADWSPDMKYISFTYGPKTKVHSLKGLLPEFPGVDAPGWNTCVADASKVNRWVAITLDGKSCKEGDWVYVPEGK
jgi:Tol biopolymer transport system component